MHEVRAGFCWQIGGGQSEQRTVEGQMGGPSVLLGNRAVARSWRDGGSMVREIAEMRRKGRG